MALSFEASRRVLQHVGRLLLLRADLAAEELGAARRRWIGWAIIALAGVALLGAAAVAAGAWLTLLLWDRFGAATLAALALGFALCGALLLRALLQSARSTPSALSQTRAALHEDYESLAAVAGPERDAESKA
jgi:hypothetical protein